MERRRHVRHLAPVGRAFVYLGKGIPLVGCEVLNISDGGARISAGEMLPAHFVLMFSQDGSERKSCRVVWRDGTNLGVTFED